MPTPPTVHLRFVPFGTRFTTSADPRTGPGHPPSTVLCANEIVVDVGGVCHGYEDETRLIFDHHFARGEDNFPSASAAVLHHAADIADRLAGQPEIWIVTHVNPDFDALCAAYLAGAIFRLETGGRALLAPDSLAEHCLSPAGWRDGIKPDGSVVRRLNWFQPQVRRDHPARWAILLAAYASCVDQGKRLHPPRTGRLHSVLYAAMWRGRPLEDGLRGVFDAARTAMNDRGLSPLFDPLFDADPDFAPETALLRHEEPAYRRDLQRARRTVVSLQEAAGDFDSWYGALCGQPLLQEVAGEPPVLSINPVHLNGAQSAAKYRQADGIFLRDPECLLFKEWAREDTEHATLGAGFLFTAIAYSGRLSAAEVNSSDYYFALDHERSGRAHLYDVWAILQEAEVLQALNGPSADKPPSAARRGFEGRAAQWQAQFSDPWFDGSNYEATIVVTPNAGSLLPGGHAADLSDDPVAQLVARCLETRAFVGLAELWDFSTRRTPLRPVEPRAVPIGAAEAREIPPDCYRFGQMMLDERADLHDRKLAERLGRRLWPFLEPAGVNTHPADFLARHLIVQPFLLVVWSRRGIIVGYKEKGRAAADQLRVDGMEEISALARELRAYQGAVAELLATPERANVTAIEATGFALLRRLLVLRLAAAMPEGNVLRRFFEATHFDEFSTMLSGLNGTVQGRLEARRNTFNAVALAIFGLLFSALSVPGSIASLLTTKFSAHGIDTALFALDANQLKAWVWLSPLLAPLGLALIMGAGILARRIWKAGGKPHRQPP